MQHDMDLQAANIANTGAWRYTRYGMAACFFLAAVLLVASLTMSHGFAAQQAINTQDFSDAL